MGEKGDRYACIQPLQLPLFLGGTSGVHAGVVPSTRFLLPWVASSGAVSTGPGWQSQPRKGWASAVTSALEGLSFCHRSSCLPPQRRLQRRGEVMQSRCE